MEAATEAPPAPVEEPQPQDPGELEGEAAGEQAPPTIELEIEGDGQLSLRVGGRQPDVASVKLRGGSIRVPRGDYERGDTLDLLCKVRCCEVHFVDKIDGSTGEITETERRHVFKVVGVEKV